MVNTNDLTPQNSGSASIGVNQVNGGFTTDIRPYAHIHMNSGVWHDPFNGEPSGVIRFAVNNEVGSVGIPSNPPGFQLSADGGKSFPLELGVSRKSFDPGAVIKCREGSLHIFSSGNIRAVAEEVISWTTINGAMSFEANSPEGLGFVSFNSSDGIEFITDQGDIYFSNLADNVGGQIEINAFSGSGRLQYRFGPHQAWYAKLTHADDGGPFNDGFWPLPHSGQISQMIAQATPGGSVDLQQAYDNGNEIDHRKDLIGYKGVLIRETIPGLGGFVSNADIAVNKPGKYGIAVSGHTLTPTDVNSYGFSALNSLSLIITSSGTPTALSRNFFLGYAPTVPSIVFFNTNGSLTFNVGDTTGTGLGGQIQFDAFAASGRLQYRFGPHQGWAAKLTHANTGGPANDGFWPLPHSGQILEAIARTPKSKAITIERPAVNNDLTIWYTNEPIFITEVESVLRGGFDASGSFAIRHSTDRSEVGTSITTLPIECTSRTTGLITTSFVSQSIPADSWLWIGVSGVSGVATSQLNITIQYLN